MNTENTLREAIENYKNYHSQGITALKKYYETLSPEDAIFNGAIGRTENGKMHPHQHRVGFKKGEVGANKLLHRIEDIQACRSFKDIFNVTETVKNEIHRLGDLWSYDTALRIGFNLHIYPQRVYIQRGVKDGVKKLFPNPPKGRTLAKEVFPAEFQELEPFEIENFLCIWGKGNCTSCGNTPKNTC